MATHCPVCGKISQDPEFCDYCNSDLVRAPLSDETPGCPLGETRVPLTPDQWNQLGDPEGFIVLSDGNHTWRVHWLPASRRDRWQPELERRAQLKLKCLPELKIVEDTLGAWVFARRAEVFEPWMETHSFDPLGSVAQMLHHGKDLLEVLEELHESDLVWANFDPQSLQRDGRGPLQISNLDVHVYPAGIAPDDVRVLARFVAPEVIGVGQDSLTPQSDVFHFALFLYCWQAGFLPDGIPTQGLEAFDYQFPPLRIYCPHLPEGIAAVLRRGLSLDPHERQATPRQLYEELNEALQRCRERRSYQGPLTWEIGAHTRTGRCKSAQNKVNEDQVLSRTFTDPARSLVAVADGISLCDVGSGSLASLIVTIVLENVFDETARADDFQRRMTALGNQGAHMLLDWAREKGQLKELANGKDLMGTTLTAGWIEGNEVQIGNLGDSRAYLLSGSDVEQLTVDGDLGTELLQTGRAPEDVAEYGMVTKALRQCIGGSKLDDEGNVTIFDEACQPTFSQWPVMPGDILILCTDGLVEEGAFLSPQALAEIRAKYPEANPQELAERLVDAADALQSLPSPLEPDGFGDNISCIVVQFKELKDSPQS